MERRPYETHFRIFGVPVAIEPSFWIAALLLGFNAAIIDPSYAPEVGVAGKLGVWVAVVLFGVLLHELGHALVARSFGAHATVRLYAFGGITFPDRRLTRAGDIFMALAGPFAGFAAAAAVWGVAHWQQPDPQGWLGYTLACLEWVTLYWGLLNLLPILPLDGGHVLAGLLGPTRQRLTLLLGGVFGILGVAYFGIQREPLPAIIFGLFALRNFQARAALRPGAQGITIDEALNRAWQALTAGGEQEAEKLGRLVLDQAPDPDSRNRARDLLAWINLAQSNRREALRHLERSEPPEAARALTWAMVLEALDEAERALPYALRAFEEEPSETSALLAMRLLVHEKRLEEAHALAERFEWPRPGPRAGAMAVLATAERNFGAAAREYEAAFDHSHAAADAYNAACSHARAGDNGKALLWLRQAVEAGFNDADQLARDPDLASVRPEPEFARLVEQLRGKAGGVLPRP